ncbi:MAG: DUF134 domain-containing protein [Candidatus Omnitrophica bacterium]|nr:DUF134 domain-containing protein [Candidatus Omnitrophota bacterium]MBU1932414.1 DUF134 domain-containing protein [Candidatus Omnitrophota bacterium]
MRPKKVRWIKCDPGEKCFRPLCKPLSRLEGVFLTLDEFEAIRLADLEDYIQADASKRMKISRPTFSRIITSAHRKIGDALVNIKAIKIEGGCCKVIKKGQHERA